MARPKKVQDSTTVVVATPEAKTKRKYTKRAASWGSKESPEVKIEGKKRGRKPRKIHTPTDSELTSDMPFMTKHVQLIAHVANLSAIRSSYCSANPNKGIIDQIDRVNSSLLGFVADDLEDYEDSLKAKREAQEAAEMSQKAISVTPAPTFQTPPQIQRQPPVPFDPASATAVEKKVNGPMATV